MRAYGNAADIALPDETACAEAGLIAAPACARNPRSHQKRADRPVTRHHAFGFFVAGDLD
jgi:hypothetical protein